MARNVQYDDSTSPAAKRTKISFDNHFIAKSAAPTYTMAPPSPERNEYENQIIDLLLAKEKTRLPFNSNSSQAHWRNTYIKEIQKYANGHGYSRTTLFLAVYYFDLFMDNYRIDFWRLHMVALNAIWLAAKLEETSVPQVSDLNNSLNYPYERKDYGDLERVMINFFDWNLLVPTAATFLEYYAEKLISEGPDEYFKNGRKQLLHGQVSLARLAFEFLDITLWDSILLNQQLPSLLAASCIAAARHSRLMPYWSEYLQNLTNYSAKDIETNMLNLLALKLNQQTDENQNVIVGGPCADCSDETPNSIDIGCGDSLVHETSAKLFLNSTEHIQQTHRFNSGVDQKVNNVQAQAMNDDHVDNDCIYVHNDMTVSATAVIWSTQQANQASVVDNAFGTPWAESAFKVDEWVTLSHSLLLNADHDVGPIANRPQVFWKKGNDHSLHRSLLGNDSPEI